MKVDKIFSAVEDNFRKLNLKLKETNNKQLEGYELEGALNDMRSLLTSIKQRLDTAENINKDEEDESKYRNLLNDYDVALKKVNKIDEGYTKKMNIERLKAGELHGEERAKAKRDMIVDQHKQIDIQGDIIHEIHNDIKDTNKNLGDIAVAVNEQGQQIDRIHGKVNDAQVGVNNADNIMKGMTRRAFCIKLFLHILIVLILILIITVLILILVKKFSPKNN